MFKYCKNCCHMRQFKCNVGMPLSPICCDVCGGQN